MNYAAVSRKRRATYLRRINELKEGVPCLDCGGEFPSFCMDFHHRDPNEKSFNIGQRLNNSSWKQISEEIKKCDLICGNCHRIRHHNEGREVVVL